MNILPTLEGGLKIDIQDPADWLFLRHLVEDATNRPDSLAHELGDLIDDKEMRQDWKDFVIPGLDEQFSSDLRHVRNAIARAAAEHGGAPGPMWIAREDGFQWFSALNQARLAIEDRFQFDSFDQDDLELLTDNARQSAYLRSQLYCAMQTLLLEHVLD